VKRANFLILSLSISLSLHILAISLLAINIEARRSPALYGWANILSRDDLFFKERVAVFPAGVEFSLDGLRKDYFFLPSPRVLSREGAKEFPPSLSSPSRRIEALVPLKVKNYTYLWERRSVLAPKAGETVTYRVYVSAYGKVLFLYPEKLPVNSGENLYFQEYIREAAFFWPDKFFWTKMEEVVK